TNLTREDLNPDVVRNLPKSVNQRPGVDGMSLSMQDPDSKKRRDGDQPHDPDSIPIPINKSTASGLHQRKHG
ncbi:MAG TPA: hypothetical protein VIX11_15560, partial [Candidatus Acidoferrum sp.]